MRSITLSIPLLKKKGEDFQYTLWITARHEIKRDTLHTGALRTNGVTKSTVLSSVNELIREETEDLPSWGIPFYRIIPKEKKKRWRGGRGGAWGLGPIRIAFRFGLRATFLLF